MPSNPANHVALIFGAVVPAFLGAKAGSFNDSYRARIASSVFYYKSPDRMSFYDQQGQSTDNLSEAWGIGYYACKYFCGAQDNAGYYDWVFLSQGVTSWLIPWLTLSAQSRFETKDQTTNLVPVLLALGSSSAHHMFLSIGKMDQMEIPTGQGEQCNITLPSTDEGHQGCAFDSHRESTYPDTDRVMGRVEKSLSSSSIPIIGLGSRKS